MHARKRWLAMLEVLLGVAVGKAMRRTWILRLLHRRGAAGLVSGALSTHHSLDLVQAHQLPGRGGRFILLALLALLALGGLLLGLQAPDVCARLQLGDVLRVLVALVARAVGLGRLGDRWPVLLLLLRLVLGNTLARLVQHLLLLQDVPHLGRLPRKVKVLVHGALNGRPAKGVVVEGIVAVIELVAEAVVRLLEVDGVVVGGPSTGEPSKGVVLAEAGRVGGVAAVLGEIGVEAEEGHGGWWVLGVQVWWWSVSKRVWESVRDEAQAQDCDVDERR